MSPSTIDSIRKAPQNDLSNASDNLYRAQNAFHNQDLTANYGSSGNSKQSILDSYQEWHANAENALTDFEESLTVSFK